MVTGKRLAKKPAVSMERLISGARGKKACADCIRGLKERHTGAGSAPAKGRRPSA